MIEVEGIRFFPFSLCQNHSLFFFPLSIASQSFFQNAPTNMASDDERRVQMQLQQELQVAYMQEFYSVSGASRESGGGGREEKRRRRRRRSAVPFAMQQEQRRPLPLFSLLLAFSLCLWFQIHQGYALNEREREMTRKATEKTNGKTSTHFLSSRPLFFRPPLDDLLFTPNLQTLSLSLSFLAAAPPFSTSSLSKKKKHNRPCAISVSQSASQSPRRRCRRASRPACRGAATATRTRRRPC